MKFGLFQVSTPVQEAVAMMVDVLCFMDVGPRHSQQDCLLAHTRIFQDTRLNTRFTIQHSGDRPVLLAVCDGLGGHTSGDAASRFVCRKIADRFTFQRFTRVEVESVLGEIQAESEAGALDRDAGTTVVGFIMDSHKMAVFNAGDSRAYKLSPSSIECLSHDHSFVQRLVDEKLITDDEAFNNPFKNFVDFGMGGVFADRWAKNFGIHFSELPHDPQAWFMLCTDGLTDRLHDKEIFNALMPDPMENAERLFNALRSKGVKDNTSFIIARISAEDTGRP